MKSICTNCALAGAVAESLRDKGWIGCRKTLELLQDELTGRSPSKYSYLSNEEIASELYSQITCEEAATGWVDSGRHPFPGRIRNHRLTTGLDRAAQRLPPFRRAIASEAL